VKKYYGKPVVFVLHRNSELGLERLLRLHEPGQGRGLRHRVARAHVTFSKAAPFIDAPFCSATRPLDKVLDADL